MYRLITTTGESLIVRYVEGSGLRKINGCIPAPVWRDRAKIASTQA